MSVHDDDNDQVGYRKPPKQHQFQKGKSGNPKGRPRKPRMERAINVRQGVRDFFEVVEQPLTVKGPGKRKRMPAIQVVLTKQLQKALDDHARSQRYLINRYLALLEVHEAANPEMAGLLEKYELMLASKGPGMKPWELESLNLLREISRRL